MLLNLFNIFFSQTGMFGGRFGHHYFGFGGGPFMIVLWILIIVGAIWLIKEVLSNKKHDRHDYQEQTDRYEQNSHNDKESPEEIARKRLAKGEINQEEYEKIIATLKND